MTEDNVLEVVQESWTAVTGRAPETVEENFFEAGGDSIAAARLALAIRKGLGCPVPLSAVFGYPTPAGLAHYIVADLCGRVG